MGKQLYENPNLRLLPLNILIWGNMALALAAVLKSLWYGSFHAVAPIFLLVVAAMLCVREYVRRRVKRRFSLVWDVSDEGLRTCKNKDELIIPWKTINCLSRTRTGVKVKLSASTEQSMNAKAESELFLNPDDVNWLLSEWAKRANPEFHGLVKPQKSSGEIARGQKLNKILRICSVVLILLNLLALWFFGLRVLNQSRSAKWSESEGKVVEMNYHYYSSARSGKRGKAELHVRYEYEVDGRLYRSDQFLVGVKKYLRDADQVNSLTNYYRNGNQVKVLFNRLKPEQAALRAEVQTADLIILGFLLTALGFLVITFRSRERT